MKKKLKGVFRSLKNWLSNRTNRRKTIKAILVAARPELSGAINSLEWVASQIDTHGADLAAAEDVVLDAMRDGSGVTLSKQQVQSLGFSIRIHREVNNALDEIF